MAGFALGLSRTLLPWKRAGVTHWLCEDAAEVHALRERCRISGNSFAAKRSGVVRTSARAERTLSAVQRESGPSGGRETAAAQHSPGGSAETVSAGQKQHSSPVKAVQHEERSDRVAVMPLERWPAAWKTLLQRTPQAPLLLWSYPELRDDLSGQSSRERSQALRRFFTELKLPRGSHGFWPFAPLYTTDTPEMRHGPACDPVFFHSGVRLLRPRTVLLLCESVPEDLRLPEIGMMQAVIHEGIRFVRMHSLCRLAENMECRPASHAQLVQFLRTLCQ